LGRDTSGGPGLRLRNGGRALADTVAQIIDPRARQWLELIVATPAVIWGGWPFYARAWRSIVSWNLEMFTPIGLGVAVLPGRGRAPGGPRAAPRPALAM